MITNKFRNKSHNTQILPVAKSIKIGWFAHLFGCWHQKMGSPFTRGNQTYCACRECGACRKFDMTRWKSVGAYFYNPIIALYETPLIINQNIDSTAVSAFELERSAEDGSQN